MVYDTELEAMFKERDASKRATGSDGRVSPPLFAWEQAMPEIAYVLQKYEPQLKARGLNPSANYGDDGVHLTLYPARDRDKIIVRYRFVGGKVITDMAQDAYQSSGGDDVVSDAGRLVSEITEDVIQADVRTALQRAGVV